MNFIELLFNVSPDGGDGTLETAAVLVALMVVVPLLARLRAKRLAPSAHR